MARSSSAQQPSSPISVRGVTPEVKKPGFISGVKDFFGIGKPGLGSAGQAAKMVGQAPVWLGKTVINTAGSAAKSLGLKVIPESIKNARREGLMNPAKVFTPQGRQEMVRRSTDILEASTPRWADALGAGLAKGDVPEWAKTPLSRTLEAPDSEKPFIDLPDYQPMDAITDIMDLSILLGGGTVFGKMLDPIGTGLSAAGKATMKTPFGKMIAKATSPLRNSLSKKFNVWASEAMTGKTGKKLREILYDNRILRHNNIKAAQDKTYKIFQQVRKESSEEGLRRVQMALDNNKNVTKLASEAERQLFNNLKSIFDDIGQRMVDLGIISEDKLVSMYNPRKVQLPFKYKTEGGKWVTEMIDMGDILKPGTKGAKGFENLMKRTQPELADVFAKGLDIADDYERTFFRYITAAENIINRERTFREMVGEFGDVAKGKLLGKRKSLVTGSKVVEEGKASVNMGGQRYWVDKNVYQDMDHFLLNPDYVSDPVAKAFLGAVDFANKIFKPLATTASPRTLGFTTVNAIGNFFNASLAGMHPLSYLRVLLPGQRAKLAKLGYKNGQDWLEAEFGLTLTEKGFVNSRSKLLWQKVIKATTFFNQWVENSAKDALALDQLAKGKNVVEARRVVDKFLFDYGDLSPYESQVLKKIIPFYTWMRKNIPTQIENFVKQPEKYMKVMAVLHNAQLEADKQLGVSRPNQAGKAPWLMNPEIAGYEIPFRSIRTPFKDKDGNQLIMKTRLPIEDLEIMAGALNRLGSALAPVPKTALEIALNKDLFTNKALWDEDAGFWEKMGVAAKKFSTNTLPFLAQTGRFSKPDTDIPAQTFPLATGLRLYSQDIPEGIKIKNQTFQGKLSDIETEARKLLYQHRDGKIADEDLTKETLRLQEKREKILDEYQKFLEEVAEQRQVEQSKKAQQSFDASKMLKRPKVKIPSFLGE